MLEFHIGIGAVNIGVQTDERISLDLVDSLMSRASTTLMDAFEGHLVAIDKYESYGHSEDCDDTSIPDKIKRDE